MYPEKVAECLIEIEYISLYIKVDLGNENLCLIPYAKCEDVV